MRHEDLRLIRNSFSRNPGRCVHGLVYCAANMTIHESEIANPAATTFNRWFIPIGAVAVHICIGSVYAWSTFNRPIQALFPDQPWWFSPPYTTFTTALVLL